MLLIFAWLALAPNAHATDTNPNCTLPKSEIVDVAAINQDATIRLGDGRRLRLANIIQIPKQGIAWLKSKFTRKRLDLAYDHSSTDRHGNLVAHAFLDKTWIQAELTGQGLAKVYSWPDIRTCVADLLAKEREARESKIGLWSLPANRIVSPEELESRNGKFVIVEGQVHSVARTRTRVFLNFGADYRTDFTLSVEHRNLKYFSGFDFSILKNKRVRTRGWLSRRNGPEIELMTPENLERLN